MKIFCIGAHKTGTTSIEKALGKLGYSIDTANPTFVPELFDGKFDRLKKYLRAYDGLSDFPFFFHYRDLDKIAKNSKFILTVREENSWIDSVLNHFGQWDYDKHGLYYEGVNNPKKNPDKYLEIYRKHNAEVQEYFKDRPDQLLIMDLAKGDGWNKLCKFLNKEVPFTEFPHLNKRR